MSTPSICWLWPVRFAATSYVLRVTAGVTTTDLPFPASGSLSTTLDYWLSGDGQTGTESDGTGRADLVAMLQTALRAHSDMGSCTVALSASSGLITVTNVASAATIRWSHANTTLDATVFGWLNDADSTTSSTVTAPNVCMGAWRPGRALRSGDTDRQPILGGITRALTGARRVSRLALPQKERDFVVEAVQNTKAITAYAPTTDPFGALEYAWTYALSYGRAWRHYPDASTIGTAAYRLYSVRDLAYPISESSQQTIWHVVAVRAQLEVVVG